MPDQPNFPIPSVIDPPKTRCIQLEIPDNNDWIRVFVGLLAQPTYWFNWQRDTDKNGKELAQVWSKLFDQIDWSNMSCCCDQPPVIFRYSDSGVYQMSSDGGTTWVDAPNYDYRNISTIFPPPSALGISTTKCQNADGVVVTINNEIVQALNDTFAAAQILALIAAVLLAVLSAGSLLAFTPLITAIGAAILDVGVAVTQAAFTTDVLDRLRCRIFNNMDSDDSISDSGLAAVLSDTLASETGIVQQVEYNIINAAGRVGIENMIRSGKGSSTANCSGCSPCNAAIWTVAAGDIVSRDDCTIIITPRTADSRISLTTGSSAVCGYYTISSAPLLNNVWLCGDGSPTSNVNHANHLNWNYDSGNFTNGIEYTFTFHDTPF